jgi:hypothetical protein
MEEAIAETSANRLLALENYFLVIYFAPVNCYLNVSGD